MKGDIVVTFISPGKRAIHLHLRGQLELCGVHDPGGPDQRLHGREVLQLDLLLLPLSLQLLLAVRVEFLTRRLLLPVALLLAAAGTAGRADTGIRAVHSQGSER